MKSKKDLVKMLLKEKDIEQESYEELLEMLINEEISVDTDKEDQSKIKFGDKVADKITAMAGSWGFILSFTFVLIAWIVLNGFMLVKPFDEFPFILLNLFLSCVAALQAPIIMMSQNRQAKKDIERSRNDYKTDLKSELILEELHNKMIKLEKNQYKLLDYISKQQNEVKDVKEMIEDITDEI